MIFPLRFILTSTVVLSSVLSLNAQTQKREIKTKTEQARAPFKICVLDFTSADIMGQKRFLSQTNQPITIPPQSTLSRGDRRSIDNVMQGFIRIIDAQDNTITNSLNRELQYEDRVFDRKKALSLYNTIVKGESRPMIVGADYLASYLGKYHQLFSCIDNSVMKSAMLKVQKDPDFPKDFMLKLAKETGATHLVYGTISDIRIKTNSFKGYGITTTSTDYQLDISIKMIDLIRQKSVYSNVYTGTHREQKIPGSTQLHNNIFHSMMTAALQQAAEDFYNVCKPGRKNKIPAPEKPEKVKTNL